jgi:hypothetical protein
MTMRATRYPELYDRQSLTDLLRLESVAQLAARLGCSGALVYGQARALGVKIAAARRPSGRKGRGPALRVVDGAAVDVADLEPMDDYERLEMERRRQATRAAGTSAETVLTAHGPKRLVRIGTGCLTTQQEDEAKRRRDNYRPPRGPRRLEGDLS